MFKVTIIAGIGLDRDGNPVKDTLAKLQRIRGALARRFGGYTESRTEGGWIKPESGELVEEVGRQWTAYTDASEAVARHLALEAAEFVSFELNQDSVVMELAPAFAGFVSQPAPAVAAIAA